MFEAMANYLVYQTFAFSPQDPWGAALQFFLADMPKLILLLTCSIFIISVIRSYVPPAKTKEFLTRRGKGAGHVLAALIGIITPFCSCSAVPLFIGFIEGGVPLGVTFSFLISSPMVNEVALVLLFGLFGWKVALLYMASGVTIAILGGYIIGRLQLEHLLESYAPENTVVNTVEFHNFSQRCQSAARFTVELLRYILPYLTVAIAIGGFIHGFVPEDFLTNYAGPDTIFAVPLAVIVGVPLYNSAGGMVPIVYSLIEKGLPLGTALAFMMAVSAISFPEMVILRKVLKTKLIGIFAGILAISIICTGYLFNLVV
ncbi:permease [uncultured Anaeromusa sp.]|uniref:permease n=1 Tax=uncultured Anaeromusa sp. TaxID=673273 RepID=UPI0029C6436D|nr:permease [uncultured Anaeromusa sp.]NCB78071.1 permease [Negativicutes bacterium]